LDVFGITIHFGKQWDNADLNIFELLWSLLLFFSYNVKYSIPTEGQSEGFLVMEELFPKGRSG